MSRMNRWGDYTAGVRARLDKGRQEYGDSSFDHSPDRLLSEIQQELMDVSGWGFILWSRLEELKMLIEDPERLISDGAPPQSP